LAFLNNKRPMAAPGSGTGDCEKESEAALTDGPETKATDLGTDDWCGKAAGGPGFGPPSTRLPRETMHCCR